MSNILEALGNGLQTNLMAVLLPGCETLHIEQEKELVQKIADRPHDLAFKLRLAIHYTQLDSTDRAQELYQEILTQDPHHLDTYLAWAAAHCST